MECIKLCRKADVSCPNQDCRNWIDFEEDLNCVLEAVDKHGNMTLREVAERIGVSFVRIKQIEDATIKKIGRFFKDASI